MEGAHALLRLPNEVIVQIMGEMGPAELLFLSLTCHTTYDLSDDEHMWMRAYNKHFPNIVRAMKQPPPPEYWKFRDFGSRRFGCLLHLELQKHHDLFSSTLVPPPPITEGELVIRVFTQNRSVKKLVLTACYLLRRLTYTPSDSSQEYLKEMTQNRITLGQNNVTQVLLDILNPVSNFSHCEDPIVTAAAICAINNLACDGNCAKIVNRAGVQLILNSMARYPEDIGVIDYSGSALANILREIEDEETVKLVRDQGIPRVHSLRKHPKVQPKNLISIFDLSTVLAIRDPVYSTQEGKNLLAFAKEVVTNHPQEETLCIVACVVIHELCQKTDDFRDEGIRLGLIPVMLHLMGKAVQPDVLYASALALCFLLWGKTDQFKDEFKQFVALTGQAIQNHTKDKKLQLGMAIIMANFASSDKAVREILATLDLNALLTHALKNFSDAEDPHLIQLAQAYGELVDLFGGVNGAAGAIAGRGGGGGEGGGSEEDGDEEFDELDE